jgi:hypothetical protein
LAQWAHSNHEHVPATGLLFRNFFGWSDEAQFCPVTANNRIKKTVQPRTRGECENSPCFCTFAARNYPDFPNFIAPKPGKISWVGFCIFTPDLRGVFLVSFLAVAKHYYRQSRRWKNA